MTEVVIALAILIVMVLCGLGIEAYDTWYARLMASADSEFQHVIDKSIVHNKLGGL